MSNAGRQFPSEMETYIDKKSGRKITKLTKTGDNFHFYFTENSFTKGDNEIIYYHSDIPYVEKGAFINFFAMDLKTGIRTQLTDFAPHFKEVMFGCATKSIDSKIILFIGDGDLYRFDTDTLEFSLLYKTPLDFELTGISISHDDRYIAITMREKLVFDREFSKTNYDGNLEHFYGFKRGRIVILTVDGLDSEVVLQDSHNINHIQFAPDTNEYLMYCHEGPWNLVQQRIWLFNTITRRVKPCYRQGANDSVGHEFWTRDGLVFFDNRGVGHDGTITVDKTQATVMEEDGKDSIPTIGFVDKNGKILRELELPYYCNHYHANADNTLLVADAVNDIVLIDIATDKPSFEVLCEHNTSWLSHNTHCHPTWSWSNDKILFASDRDRQGCAQLYLIDMNEK